MSFFTWIFVIWIVGSIIRAINEKIQAKARENYTANARLRVIEGVAGMLSKMAKADGHVSKEEVDVAQQFLRSFKFTEGELGMAKRYFNLAMDNGYGIEYYARMFASVASTEACRLIYEMLWGIAAADGHLDPAEDRQLRQAASALGFDDAIYFFYRRVHLGDFYADHAESRGSSNSGSYGYRSSEDVALQKAYSRLGCSASDSDEKVRSAYRKQAMRYHPDRLRAEGLPEGMLAQANKSMAEINAAWDLIRESRKLH